jgi:simple sugar transport system ATP-binding protein
MSDHTPILEIRDVSKHYGGLRALHEVTLHAHAGEVVGLVGDNGAGKSTLLKIIAGAQLPSSGDVVIDGVPRHFTRPTEAVDAGITTVYQDLALAMQRNVVANFFIGRELVVDSWLGRRLGWLDTDAMTRTTQEELARLHTRIPDVQAMCLQLSGGQRQALAIARAAAWCRRVLLLDEPTSALGVEQQREVLDLIRRIRAQGVAIVLVSHQMQDVVSVCDRVTVLRLGEVVATLTRQDITVDNLIAFITGARGPADGQRSLQDGGS